MNQFSELDKNLVELMEQMLEREGSMPPVAILLNGPPGSGKDVGSEAIWKKFSEQFFIKVSRVKMASPISWGIWNALSLSPEEFQRLRERDKDKPFCLESDNGLEPFSVDGQTFRDAMISFSEDFMKKIFGQDVFAKLLSRRINEIMNMDESKRVFTVSDCGFQNEYDAFVELFDKMTDGKGLTILVNCARSGHTFAGDSREWVEINVSDKKKNYIWHNRGDDGSLEELVNNVCEIVANYQ